MACNTCETSFKSMTSAVVSIVKSGTTALLYVQNQGRNILQLRRIVVCSTAGNTFYLRPAPSGITWSGPEYLEPGGTSLYYSWTPTAGSVVQAQAEYIEIDGRSRSCSEQF
jgi:hypothetical protein